MKYFLTLCLFTIAFSSYSQNTEVDEDDKPQIGEDNKRGQGNSELSINALNLIIAGAVDLSYERILNNTSSLNIGLFFKIADDSSVDVDDIYAKDFALTGTYKYFINENKHAGGFYISGFGMVSNGRYDDFDDDFDENGNFDDEGEVDYTDFALGVGVGGKFVTKKGLFFDTSINIGRNLLNEDAPRLVALLNGSIGFRF